MDVLSVDELSSLLDILGQEDKPLEAISAKFQKTYHKPDHFKVCCTIYVMLKDDLLQPPSRLAAFYILYDLYTSEPLASNPFLPIFINTAQNENTQENQRIVERNFVIYLLSSPPKEVFCPRYSKSECSSTVSVEGVHKSMWTAFDLLSLPPPQQLLSCLLVYCFTHLFMFATVVVDEKIA